jgi:hypothetical protein
MVAEMKQIPLNALQEIARELTFAALKDYHIPDEYNDDTLYLEVLFDGEDRVFELLSTKPQHGTLISQTRVNAITGEGKVEKILLPQK